MATRRTCVNAFNVLFQSTATRSSRGDNQQANNRYFSISFNPQPREALVATPPPKGLGVGCGGFNPQPREALVATRAASNSELHLLFQSTATMGSRGDSTSRRQTLRARFNPRPREILVATVDDGVWVITLFCFNPRHRPSADATPWLERIAYAICVSIHGIGLVPMPLCYPQPPTSRSGFNPRQRPSADATPHYTTDLPPSWVFQSTASA